MKLELLLLSLLLVVVHFATSEVTIGYYTDPSHPGQCVLHQLVLSPGEVAKHPEICAKITCHKDGKASTVTCAEMIAPPGCKVGDQVNPEAIYPNCCRKKIICDNGRQFNS